MVRFAREGGEHLAVRDVQEIKVARTHSAVDALPQELFTKTFNLPTNGNGYHAGEDTHKPLHQFVRRFWEMLLECERTGAFDLRSNKQSRRACADARQFITEIKKTL
jgi:hypothetical protein